jgi:hypothetical protein
LDEFDVLRVVFDLLETFDELLLLYVTELLLEEVLEMMLEDEELEVELVAFVVFLVKFKAILDEVEDVDKLSLEELLLIYEDEELAEELIEAFVVL